MNVTQAWRYCRSDGSGLAIVYREVVSKEKFLGDLRSRYPKEQFDILKVEELST